MASIQTLARRLESEEFQEEMAVLGERAASIVFDEAHHVVAPTFTQVMQALGLSRNKNYLQKNRKTAPPLLGLTATPARTANDETQKLSRRFHGVLIEPNRAYRSLKRYQDQGFISHMTMVEVPTGWTLKLTEKEAREQKKWQSLPSSAIRRAGADPERTARIIQDLEKRLDTLRSILVFACSVGHAHSMAEVLTRLGYDAAAVDGETSRSVRWQTIQRFRNKELQILVNCDLLATGFDAPQIDAIAIARPISSPILWSQIIGRGRRGPRNGGTRHCTLIDYQDNLQGHGDLDNMRAQFRDEFLVDHRDRSGK